MCSIKLVPVGVKMLADTETPISIFMKLAHLKPVYLLESVERGEWVGRYSFIGIDPILNFSHQHGKNHIKYQKTGVETISSGGPIELLEELMAGYELSSPPDFPPFYGGLVGYLGYEFIHYYEPLKERGVQVAGQGEYQGSSDQSNGIDDEMPQCYFTFCQKVVIYDHVEQSLSIVVLAEENIAEQQRAQKAISQIQTALSKGQSGGGDPFSPKVTVRAKSNVTKEQFFSMVNKAKEYIRAGDIFQVVLSQRFQVPLNAHPFTIYRRLRNLNPSPYLYYLDLPGMQVIGSSPEMLVKVEQGKLETRPIAGTRHRGAGLAEDEALAQELLSDEKERAEHIMLVDLGRNDLGRVSQIGTVELTKFMEVEKYSHVMHLVSVVQGQLKQELPLGEAVKSCFPAGTVSGAPKIRAMEIIRELEPNPRGVYAGAIMYLGLSGNLDSCIAIRTIVIRNNMAYVQAGAGIVNDSKPEAEYQETINKARALLEALGAKLETELVEEPTGLSVLAR